MGLGAVSSPPTSTAPASNTTSRAPAITLSMQKDLRSPRPFKHASRKQSFLPVSTPQTHSLSIQSTNKTTDDAMTTPAVSPAILGNHTYQPLHVRSSTLYPFTFNLNETMAAMDNGDLALPSSDTKKANYDNKSDYDLPQLSPTTSKASSDTMSPDKKHPSEYAGMFPSELKTEDLKQAAESLLVNTPTSSLTNLADFNTGVASTPVSTPSKNNPCNLVRERQVRTEDSRAKYRGIRTTIQPPVNSSMLQIHQANVNVATLRKSGSEDESPKNSLKSLLSPRSTKTYRNLGARDVFGAVTPSKSREVTDGNEIVGDLEFLRTQPPRDLSQHPIMAADPFTSCSNAPLKSTHMSLTEARQWAVQYYREKRERWTERQVRPFVKGEPLPVFRQPEWIATGDGEASTHVVPVSRKTSQSTTQEILASEASPIANNVKAPKTPLSIDTKAANSPTHDIHLATRTATPLTDDLSRKSGSAGIRSFSGLFKSRSSAARTSFSSTGQDAVTPEEKRDQSRTRKERYLRTITNCQSFDYTPTSVYPRHPNTGRDWRSRNLRCAACQWITCNVCGRACCARAACFYAMENHRENPEGIARAKEIKEMIESIIPTDTEVQTFLTCTSCKKEVCPDCCGICPNEACQDIQCRRCKHRDPWDECDWHKQEMIGRRESISRTRMRSTI